MKATKIMASLIVLINTACTSTAAQNAKLGENGALRYWAAFGQMQDAAITPSQAKEINGMLDGTLPYDDSKFNEIVEKNRPAIEIMQSGTAIPNCDWGLDYKRGPDEPVDYVRKALALGRLNVLYAFHQSVTGDKDGTVKTLVTGLRFSRDVANGGTLFATLVAKDLLTTHFRAIEFVLKADGLSSPQRRELQKALTQLSRTQLDWRSAIQRELGIDRKLAVQPSLQRVTQAYVSALDNPSALPQVQQMIAALPQGLRELIPNPKRVVEEKEDFGAKLERVQLAFR